MWTDPVQGEGRNAAPAGGVGGRAWRYLLISLPSQEGTAMAPGILSPALQPKPCGRLLGLPVSASPFGLRPV